MTETPPPPTASPSPAHAKATPSAKRIVMCLDGTGNEIGLSRATNVAKIYQMLDLRQPSRQVAFYDPGIGTLPSPTARGKLARSLSQARQMAFGVGLRANLTESYAWLMEHYHPGDELFVFGFSRGAYTARALVGMLARPGLLRPGCENLVDYAVALYAVNGAPDAKRRQGLCEFADSFCWGSEHLPVYGGWPDLAAESEFHEARHRVPVHYLGLFDTVKAAGVAGIGNVTWAETHRLRNAQRVRHAVSIDEQRPPFREFLVIPRDGVEEVWFAGVHSDVGGTFQADAGEPLLSTIPLKWVAEPVVDQLLLRESALETMCRLTEEQYRGRIHAERSWWRLAGKRVRPRSPEVRYHASVRARRAWEPSYLPELTDETIYDDPDWAVFAPIR